MSCPFCELQKKKERILASSQYTIVVLSNPRLMPGHTLVIPKRHIEHLSELTKDEKEELFDVVIEFQERILKRLSSGCDIRQNNRPFLPQSEVKVNHVHIHLQPRELEDGLYQRCQIQERPLFERLSEEEINRIFPVLK